MTKRIALIALVFIFFFTGMMPVSAQDISQKVVKIVAIKQEYDYYSPWMKKALYKVTMSGCLVTKNLILTSAYSLSDHIFVEVMKQGVSKKYPASVVVKDYSCGLALLSVPDPSFYSDLSVAELTEAKKILGEKLSIYRWDAEGNFREYKADVINTSIRMYKPNCAVLMHTMTTEMEAGGYGEPVFKDDKLAGISTGFESGKKNVLVLGVDTIRRMLDDMADGSYEGMPLFWIDGAPLESDVNLRDYLSLKDNDSGVMIDTIHPLSSGSETLKSGDVILSINGVPLEDTGLYLSPAYGKLNFHGLIYLNHLVHDTIQVNVLRDKQEVPLSFRLKPVNMDKMAVPFVPFDTQPDYIILGGCIFQYLSLGYMKTWGSNWEKLADKRLLHYYRTYLMKAADDDKMVIVLNRVLPATVNSGYQEISNIILTSVNGIKVKNLVELKKAVLISKDKFLTFDFVGDTKIVLERDLCIKSEAGIMKTYGISSPDYISR